MSRLRPQLVRSAAVAALGSFLFGFDTAVISGTTEALRLRFGLDSAQLGFTVASALLGTILGALAAGKPSERYGRRPVLRALAVLYLISAAGCGLAPGWISLLVFRFIGGLAIGGSSVVAPMYIAEIAPADSARTAGRAQPVQRRGRHPRRLPVELRHRGDGRGPGVQRLAGDARDPGRARGAVLRVRAAHPREPALAGQAASARGGGRGAAARRQRRPGRPWWARSRSRCTRRPSPRTSRSSSGSIAGPSCSRSWWRPSTSSRASTPSSTTPPTSSRWRGRAARARSCSRS